MDSRSYRDMFHLLASGQLNPNKHSCHADWPRPCEPAVSKHRCLVEVFIESCVEVSLVTSYVCLFYRVFICWSRANCLHRLLSSTSLRPLFMLSVSLLGLMLLERWKPKLPIITGKPRHLCLFGSCLQALSHKKQYTVAEQTKDSISKNANFVGWKSLLWLCRCLHSMFVCLNTSFNLQKRHPGSVGGGVILPCWHLSH